MQDTNELSDSQITGTDCTTIIKPVIKEIPSHHAAPMEKWQKASVPTKSIYQSKISNNSTVTSFTRFIKKKRSPSNVSYGARSIYNGNGLNVSDGALRTEGYLNVAAAAYPNEGSQNVPNGALLNSRSYDTVCTINLTF